ncbi:MULTISPECIES: alpha-ketoglutarate-dependent dioxygenase AlkB [unclassified Roseateles]|uniref:alpha-ketoglutarate-dependent dioxygenase AlkB n=1 Tax=unclassified Roseateles TaxID=2626991 RepID=UPI0006FFC2A8|nr:MULTISPECIES: alpha-ketoglutarate-dependent dioxygenase AlkB [unclassified Roseateles]KQW43293.1 2OG-Fe(II) oxygenase [Pelomonas sp. Root405]KRA71031.1 2OG-Fe(II) oxygenase [Pelomonas sp. Root662]
MQQESLFADLAPSPGALPEGLVYEPEFLSREEEDGLIEVVRQLPLQEAKYKEYTARRRVVSYGGKFDYDSNELLPSAELDEALLPLRARVAVWAGVEPEELVHALVAEYSPGTPLGWHRDVPDFESIFGVSLGSDALLRFRPYPPDQPRKEDVIKLSVMPRSIYAMRGAARWDWQHSVAPVHELRWSITFRTPR